ncbi:MAG: hypothetical protein SVX43_07675 [Cyanobacteriota bacterium]|nr:hypothetical protein [Cyanobacteriota bacterium]
METSFVSGTSISTNTFPSAFYNALSKNQDSKKYKATHFNYPGLDIPELYNRHRQHIVEVGAREGRVKRVEPSLLAIAQLTDEFLVKQDKQ